MSTTWNSIPVPRPLQQLFDSVPLVTYDANALPTRAQSNTLCQLPTLYVFASERDARLGLPSYNPSCLKWQTFLKLAGVEFRIVPSTNHASPTGALPFLLPVRTSPTTTAAAAASSAPIPASRLQRYALDHGSRPPPPNAKTLRLDAYQALLDVPIRNAWLHTLYLEPENSPLLEKLYVTWASSSGWVQGTIRHQLGRAAEGEILKTSSSLSAAGAGELDEDAVYSAARDALNALASLLAESETGWFFSATAPTLFDASVFAYTHLMLQVLSEADGEDAARLGVLVGQAGSGELRSHQQRIYQMLWPSQIWSEGESQADKTQ
ncbi:hypothetical protein B0H63DRAFT_486621 [Podospora didyma]|uniref:Thioredoxin-like fold domain-containing protein n=1 Tax=Podospora didyma TaxID=330526 RepID=A0AAE0K558_9PEZI|nr:hypothetical protein B0H63DRAFT_486621 [Podospora didyma]